MSEAIIKSTCGLCYAGCGVLVYVNEGSPKKIKGDIAD